MNIHINTRSIAAASRAMCPATLRPATLLGRRSRRERADGFTLIELLVSISIIGIIAAFSAGVVYTAQEAARRTASEAIISKLHSQMTMRWEDYATRRVGVQRVPSLDTQVIAAQRVLAIQELMRFELPDQYIDIFDPNDASLLPTPQALTATPSLTRAYRRRVRRQVVDRDQISWDEAFEKIAATNQSSECLYLIMTTGMIDETSGGEFFSGRETGDTDGDGMLEFIDGWGRPVEWIRWPTAFLSDLQPGTVLSQDASGQQQISRDIDVNRDPFNPTGVDEQMFTANGPRPNDGSVVWGYRLAPLITSLGGDGFKGFRLIEYHVSDGPTSATNAEIIAKASDPYAVIIDEDDGPVRRADILLNPSKGSNVDNIHNHLIGTR